MGSEIPLSTHAIHRFSLGREEACFSLRNQSRISSVSACDKYELFPWPIWCISQIADLKAAPLQ
jgi:hypothetical protein